MLPWRRFLFVIILALTAACTHPSAFKAAKHNGIRISSVMLNQTTEQVRSIMGKGPESMSQRMVDGGVHESTWYYLTNYDNEVNTAITFRNNRVVGITQSPWLGDGVFLVPERQ